MGMRALMRNYIICSLPVYNIIFMLLEAEAEMAGEYLRNYDWRQRIEGLFAKLDANKDGYLGRDDWGLWVDNTAKAPNADPALVEKLRQSMRQCFAPLRLTNCRRSTRDEFIKDVAAFAVAERLKKEKGEEPLSYKLNNAWYDAVDTNHDGTVTLDEYRTIMRARNFDESRLRLMLRLRS